MYLERVDPVSVALKRVQTFLALWVPHLHHVVIGSRHDQSAVVLYATHSRQMPHQHVQTLTALYVPHSQRRIPRPAHHPVKVTLVSHSIPLHSILWGDHVPKHYSRKISITPVMVTPTLPEDPLAYKP